MKRVILLFFLFHHVTLSAQYAYILNRPYAEHARFTDSIKRKLGHFSGSATQIDTIEQWAEKKNDKELKGELSLLRLKIKMDGLKFESADENELKEIVIAASRNKLTYLEADALELIADYYWMSSRKRSLALENYVSAYNIYERFTFAEFPPKEAYLFALGSAYIRYEDYDNAIKYLKLAAQAPPAEDRYHSLANTITNSIGISYRKQRKYDTAERYFREIYDRAVKTDDSAWMGIAAGNIGNVYFYEKKYAEAIPMLNMDIRYGIAKQQVKSAVGSMIVLSQVYYYQHDIERAEKEITEALRLFENKGFTDHSVSEQMYTQLARVYAAKNDMRRAYLFADSALTAKDSVEATRNALNVAKAQEKIDYIRHKLDTEQLTNEKQLQQLVRNCLVGGILMICVIGILFINRQRLQQKKLEAEKKNAESELDIAAMTLDNIRQSVQEKNRIIEHFTAEIEKLKTGAEEETENELLTKLESATILTDEQWENFRITFEKVHKGFFVSLKQKIPDLTPAEIRFLALTKLKLTSKEMASMLGISTNAIRIYKHRLRRKLDLDKEDMIEELVEGI